MKFSEIFRDATGHLLRWLALLFVAGCAILIAASIVPFTGLGQVGPLAKEIVDKIGLSMLIATFVILVLDVALRKEMIADLEGVLERSRATSGIREYAPQRKRFDTLIAADVRSAPRGATLSLLGITQKPFFTDAPGSQVIIEKVISGCHVRVLIMHPQSKILPCYQTLSRDFGSPNLLLSISASALGTIRAVQRALSDQRAVILGTFEVRMFQDLLSTLFVYCGHQTSLFGTYMSHERGTLSPAFVVSDSQLQLTLQQHFDCLWRASEAGVLFRASRMEYVDNADGLFGSMATGGRVESAT